MELIVINQSKLKIMLTPPDMQRYALSPGQLDCTDEQTRRSFRRIFDDVRLQTGFDTAGERLFVQLYTSKGGGCEIFVTKLGEKCDVTGDVNCDVTCDVTCDVASLTVPEQALLRKVFSAEVTSCDIHVPPDVSSGETAVSCAPTAGVRQLRPLSTRPSVFLFENMTSLLTVCKRMNQLRYAEPSYAYIIDGREPYCLLIYVPDTSLFCVPARFDFLSEYGREVSADRISCYLGEYGRALCEENAVERLGTLA